MSQDSTHLLRRCDDACNLSRQRYQYPRLWFPVGINETVLAPATHTFMSSSPRKKVKSISGDNPYMSSPSATSRNHGEEVQGDFEALSPVSLSKDL